MWGGNPFMGAIQEFSELRSDYASGIACVLVSFSSAAWEVSTIPRRFRRMGREGLK